MKNSFVLYYDLAPVFSYLTDEEAGKMIKAVFNYEINGEHTQFEDRMMASTFIRIADNLDRNKMRYEKSCERKREALLKRWENNNNGMKS